MAIPQNKAQLLEAIVSEYSKLKSELETVTEIQSTRKEMEGHVQGTRMSVRNLVSYLIGWGELVLKWNDKHKQNEMADLPDTGFKWNELGKLAQKFYKDYETYDLSHLQKKLDSVVEEIINLINNNTNKQLYGEHWYKQWTLGRLIQLNTSSPYKNALQRVRKWKKERSPENN